MASCPSLDVVKNTIASRPSERSKHAGESMADFSTIRVSYAPQNELVAALDEIRLAAVSIREKRATTGRRIPMPALRAIAEMGVGKTWGAEKLESIIASRPGFVPGTRPVLIATLDTSGSPASIPMSILKALREKRYDVGKPQVLWSRAHQALRRYDVQLCVFDEMNRAARRSSLSPAIGGDLMDFLLEGEAGVAFLGTSEANQLFNRVPALRDRLKSPVILKTLDFLIPAEKEFFIDFLRQMDAALVAEGILGELANLEEERTAAMLWEVCRGRLRPLCQLLEAAVTAVHRRGEAKLTSSDLLDAVEEHSIPNEVIFHNPFAGEKAA